jgi:kynureninase
MITRDDLVALDTEDPLADRRALFVLPDDLIYLDGNSLGAQPASITATADEVLGEWRSDLIGGWTDRGWWEMPSTLGDRIGGLLLGAEAGQVVVTDTVTVNLFKLLSAAVRLRPDRAVILVAESSFPTDRYVVDAVARRTGHEVRVVPRGESVADHLDESVGVAVLEHVDFRTAEIRDLPSTTAEVRSSGALSIWDLSHSAGVMKIELDRSGTDFAVGCTYKFLNGGPGAPAFLYAASQHLATLSNPIPGWLGHADPFAMTGTYAPDPGVRRFLTGTHSVTAMRLVDGALDAFEGVDIVEVRAKSSRLTSTFIDLLDERAAGLGYEVVSPRSAEHRGSQVTLHHVEAPAVFDRLVSAGLRGDLRSPSLLRFGFAPLYNTYVEVWDAVEILRGAASG